MDIKILQPQCIHELGSRQNQEDSVWPLGDEATADSRLFVLCDGMGGHEHGEVASRLVCDVLSQWFLEHWRGDVLDDDMLRDAVDEVFRHINLMDNGTMRQMGTTLTLLCLHRGGVTMAHIGDSRIYHLRPQERRMLYKTRDHSLAWDLFLAGEITHEEMATYGKKNVITRAIMPGLERQPKMDIAHTTDVQPGDYFFLCSDGMLEQMSDAKLVALLSDNKSDEIKCKQLIDATRNNADNHSAWMVHVQSIMPETGDDALINDEAIVKSNALLLEDVTTATQRKSIWQRFKDYFRRW